MPTPDDSLLAFDFGTSYFKAALVGGSGRIECLHRAASPITHFPDGRSEMPILHFEQAIAEALAALARQSPWQLAGVRAVSFSTQANTFTLLDAAGHPLIPFIVWNDTRAQAMNARWSDWSAEPGFSESTGLPRLDHEFAACKLNWLAEHPPQGWERVRRLCFLSDYFTRWFTGEHVCEASIAALSGLFDVPSWGWSAPWLERCGVPMDWLAPVVRAGREVGLIHPHVAETFGLPRDCRFIAGCLDQYAGAIGVGNVQPGLISETTGTVLATVRCAERFAAPRRSAGVLRDAASPILRGPGPTEGVFYHMTVGDVSGNLLHHYQQCLEDHPSAESLDEAARTPDAGGLVLDPHWPLSECKQRLGAWARTEPRGRVVRCIYQAVAEALAGQVEALQGGRASGGGGKDPQPIRAGGGGARSRLWLQIKADRLGIPMLVPRGPEPALLGAAVLAAGALGWVGFAAERLEPKPEHLFWPQG